MASSMFKVFVTSSAILCAAILASSSSAQAAPAGTAFTYQGRLNESGTAATGPYDFQFSLYSVAAGGAPSAGILSLDDVAVNTGLFSVSLDFGTNAFPGRASGARWLEIAVRPGASTGAYTTMVPRAELLPVPYAQQAATAASLTSNSVTLNETSGTVLVSLPAGQASTTRLQVDGQVYSTSGGYKFPDGTVQLTAASQVINFSTATPVAAETTVGSSTNDQIKALEQKVQSLEARLQTLESTN